MWPDTLTGPLGSNAYTGTHTGTYTPTKTHYYEYHTKNPISWAPTGGPDQPLVTLQLAMGDLKIYPNGRVEYPGTMDQSADRFWDYCRALGQRCFQDAVRAEAARLVREVVPTLVDLDDYQKATLPSAVAAAASLP